MLSRSEVNRILGATQHRTARVAPYNIENSTDARTIEGVIKSLELYEKKHGGVWGVALLQNNSIGGVYLIMPKEEYAQHQPTAVNRQIQFWPKSYFLNLRQKLLQDT